MTQRHLKAQELILAGCLKKVLDQEKRREFSINGADTYTAEYKLETAK